VGIRLGCLNHAMLTVRAIAADGLQLTGWIANSSPSATGAMEKNINSLKLMINEPLLGVIPALDVLDCRAVAHHLILP
jgi:dethiobiotin synthetase